MDEPPKKRARKDHALESHASSSAKSVSRFPAPTGSPTMNKICKGYVPQNTNKATGWALRVFNTWQNERNRVSADKWMGWIWNSFSCTTVIGLLYNSYYCCCIIATTVLCDICTVV